MRKGAGGRVVAALTTALLLTACGAGGYQPKGPFRPLPEGAPPEVGPPSSPAPAPGRPPGPGSDEASGDPNVVASGLAVPTGLVVLPDGSAIVGERDTGRLLQVFPDRSPARELMTVPGIDAAGEGGLLGLALSPTHLEDGLVYAYVSTATDNRVVRFPLGGTPNPVFTGIPRSDVRNGGGLIFAPDGTLFVGTGDSVLHIDVFGQPVGATPVYSTGYRDVTALCQGGPETMYATDEALVGPDELNLVTEGPVGAPVAQVLAEEGGLGGCAAAGRTVFLAALDGEGVHVLTLDQNGAPTGDPDELLGGRYGRLRSVALDAEGALWVTTSNRDGVGTPAEDDDKVLRVMPPSTAGGSPL
jgi:glucose/arabinose dehydrogenase